MATGDQKDMIGRLRAVLPQGWFPATSAGAASTTPVLDTVLAGFASALAWGYSLVEFALGAVLMPTAQNIWLDLHAQDYLADTLQRRTQETDASFLPRVQDAIFPPGATRAALIGRLTQLTGAAPVAFEPEQPLDTGALNYGGTGLNVSGGLGSLALPFQAFVTVKRPVSQGVPNLAGLSGYAPLLGSGGAVLLGSNGQPLLGNSIWQGVSGTIYAPGGLGSGLIALENIATAFDGVTDADIYATVAAAEPAGSIVWTRITP